MHLIMSELQLFNSCPCPVVNHKTNTFYCGNSIMKPRNRYNNTRMLLRIVKALSRVIEVSAHGHHNLYDLGE